MELKKVLETCLYAKDLDVSEHFYTDVLGLKLIRKEEGRHLFYRCGDSMLLIFNPDHTSEEQTFVGDRPVPLHGAFGSIHIAFAVDQSEFKDWKSRLKRKNIKIESSIKWPGGLKSIYFRDPSGNSIEIIESGMWNIDQ